MGVTKNLTQYAKNIFGQPRLQEKIIVFSVDDYGNVRLDSARARARMDQAGMKVMSRFDAYDTLETPEDLIQLFDVLRQFKGGDGRHPIFTAFSLPCNIDFERMHEESYQRYLYELLPDTFNKLPGYESTMDVWKQGIESALIKPQFHGREHFNLKVFNEKLIARDKELLTCLQNRSYTSISSSGYSTISYTAAFEFWRFEENKEFSSIIKTGLEAFAKVFGEPAVHFNPPGGREHSSIYEALSKGGIRYMDTPWIKKEHQGLGKYKRIVNRTGKNTKWGQKLMLRNAVFEPNYRRGFDWVGSTLRQIDTAFKLNRPAIISSHRVNFCGLVDESNRKDGLRSLHNLLAEIIKRWPETRFMSADALMQRLS